MSIINLHVNCVAYNDTKTSNNPSIRIFDVAYKLPGKPASKPKAEDYTVAPGATMPIFSGVRSTSIDGTTEFSLTKPNANQEIYRLTHTGGTAPAFRDARDLQIDNTTELTVTVNGPIAVISHTGGTALDTTDVQIGDFLKLTALSGFSQSNRGTFTIIAKTASSLTIRNSNAANETAVITASEVLAYSAGSNNKAQIEDKIKISAGFSVSSYGTYEISDVTPSYIEFRACESNGMALETGIIPGAAGLTIYHSAKKFILIAAQQKCSIELNGNTSESCIVEPIEVNNPETPGLFMKHGLTYDLSVKNLSLEPLKIIIVSVE